MKSYVLSIIITLGVLVLLHGCSIFENSEDQGYLVINIEFPEDATRTQTENYPKPIPQVQDFDRVHCTVTKDGSTVWDNDLTLSGNYFTVDITLDVGSGYAVELRCYESNQMTYTGYQSGISIRGGEITSVTISLDVWYPLAPTNLTAAAVSSSRIVLQWIDNSLNELGFEIERKTGAGGTFAAIDTATQNATTYEDIDLQENTTYYYRVFAYNSAGCIDWSNTASATTFERFSIVGSYPAPNAVDVVTAGGYVYISDYDAGLIVIDISDPMNPLYCGTCETLDHPNGITISGNLVYVADSYSGLLIIDVSSPSNPVIVQDYDTPAMAWSVEVMGDYAYVGDYSGGLQVINVSNPLIPLGVGECATRQCALGVAIREDIVYIADMDSGLCVVDVHDPSLPNIIATYSTLSRTIDVTLHNDYAFIAAHTAGLVVFDISTPANPVEVGYYNTPGYAWGISIIGNFAYLADSHWGLRVFDISDPENLSEIGYCNTPGIAYKVAVSGNYAYVADQDEGIQIIYIGE